MYPKYKNFERCFLLMREKGIDYPETQKIMSRLIRNPNILEMVDITKRYLSAPTEIQRINAFRSGMNISAIREKISPRFYTEYSRSAIYAVKGDRLKFLDDLNQMTMPEFNRDYEEITKASVLICDTQKKTCNTHKESNHFIYEYYIPPMDAFIPDNILEYRNLKYSGYKYVMVGIGRKRINEWTREDIDEPESFVKYVRDKINRGKTRFSRIIVIKVENIPGLDRIGHAVNFDQSDEIYRAITAGLVFK